MPRLALCCKIGLNLKKVTCPGTLHLADRNLVFITVSILAQSKRTNSVFASFPFAFHEKLSFERIFTNASNLDQLLEILEDEIVSIELRQYSERHYDGQVIAKFEAPSRQFLFPTPSFAPKDDVNRELLLTRTASFSAERGIDPKLEFSTRTKIEETMIASSSREHLSSANANTSKSSKKTPSPNKASYPLLESSSSETEEEVVITTPRQGANNNSIQFQHCVCECRNRPENNGRYVIRSRSVSPGKGSAKKSHYYKPPFRAGKAPEDLISRRNFGDSPLKANNFNDKDDFPCPNCLVPHPDCSMCMAYKKTYGNSFLRHRFSSDIKRVPPKTSPSPSSIRMKTRKSKSTMPKARARIPITSPGSSEDDESYRAAFAVASQRRENGSTMFGRSSNGGISPSKDINRSRDYVRDTVKDLLKKNDSVLQYELTDSELEDSFMSDISVDEAIIPAPKSPQSIPDRSIVVPLNGDKYWSQNAQKYTGKSHREIFNDSLGEIYKSLYRGASVPD